MPEFRYTVSATKVEPSKAGIYRMSKADVSQEQFARSCEPLAHPADTNVSLVLDRFRNAAMPHLIRLEDAPEEVLSGEELTVPGSCSDRLVVLRPSEVYAVRVDAPASLEHVLDGVRACESLERAVAQLDTDGIVRWALIVGQLAERLAILPIEPYVATEASRRDAAHKSAVSLNQCYTDLHDQYQLDVDSLVDGGKGLSYTKATEEVATKYGVSGRTVRGRTENKYPRNRGRRH